MKFTDIHIYVLKDAEKGSTEIILDRDFLKAGDYVVFEEVHVQDSITSVPLFVSNTIVKIVSSIGEVHGSGRFSYRGFLYKCEPLGKSLKAGERGKVASERGFSPVTTPRSVPELKVQVLEGGTAPIKKNPTDSCYDLTARRVEYINPWYRKVYLGVKVQPEEGYDVRLYARSSIGNNTGWVLANSVGIIDEQYRDELCAIFVYAQPPNLRTYTFSYSNGLSNVYYGEIYFPYKEGDRAVQMEMRRKLDYDLTIVDEVDSNDRGGGFGSTGK